MNPPPKQDPTILSDAWDGTVWKEMKDTTDASKIYTTISGNLVFSFYVDWFNPFGNKYGGKSVSLGSILLVCMNLPPEDHYLEENLFLFGVIPGPKEPSLDQINNFLLPLVNEFETFQKGIWFNATALHPHGHQIKAILCS